MSIPFVDKVNERSSPVAIINEQHLVGILATITYSPGNIRLIEVPQAPAPFSTVDIWSGSGHTGTHYNEITSGTPTGTQYLVDYTTGVVSFATAQDGNTVFVDYHGLGSEWAAEDVNEIQNPLSTVATQVVTYNWPSAPTVSWKLADTIVKPASISTTATDDFTFPRDIIVTRHLTTLDLISDSVNPASTGVIRLANNSDTISWRNFLNNGDLALTVNASNQLTFNGTPIELGTLTSAHLFVGNGSNVATDTAVTGDVTINNTGVTAIGSAKITNTMLAGSIDPGKITIASADIIVGTAGNVGVAVTMSGDVHINNMGSTTIQPAVVTGNQIASSTITNTNLSSGVFGAIMGVGSQSQILNMNSHKITNITDPSSAQDAATKNYVDSNFLMLSGGTLTGALGIGETPDASAELDVASITKGLLPPRMTTTQRDAIVSPATGLQIFNTTTNAIEVWSGIRWNSFGNIVDIGDATTSTQLQNNPTSTTITQSGTRRLVLEAGSSIEFGAGVGQNAKFYFNTGVSSSTKAGIGTLTPDASAALDVTSTVTGFLPPRMTNTQRDAISSPASGLIIYSTTDNQWEGWNGSSWAVLG